MTAEIIKFPGRKRINPNEFRITDDRRSNIRYKQQTLEEIPPQEPRKRLTPHNKDPSQSQGQ